ncbi:BlaI/MecI/CopY family transcriptional regulator [Marinicella gelatinilytica]|uniref:BlaI/MecI/CopY family transcriptional regulator n=1 Tax=Marinicella gelatinilytica TaxID=2996017 RepID=UPI002260D869|nr:BlaI/MecI/CopY family transcriptional regulator [Marinicella gelatinilytica]MCX7546270.1 BlaI/MecI/CopY family transcriptional regulator [Marinicella gelatinilytica]
MNPDKLPLPTPKELLILSVLWKFGPSTVRVVHEHLKQRQQTTTYTTTLKMMQVMLDKQLLEKNNDQMAHIYTPRASQESTQLQLTQDLINRAYNGKANDLINLLKKTTKA